MSIHLVGGGLLAASDAAASFLAEATARSAAVGRSAPRIGLLSVADESGASPSSTADIASVLGDAAEVLVTEVQPGQPLDTSVLSDIDALVVGGGRTPDYLDAVLPLVDQIRLLVSDGLPYLGYSAGAMIAADRALVGGWRVGGVEVCRQDASEGLDEVELREGLGLVDLTIDVHAVQAGTISRLIASAEAEFVTAGLAIDEDTVLVVGEGALEVRGAGSVWRVVSGDDSVSVATMGA
ncbi:Type 1 glutamine amidotransferase-like domain-containing protein [Curtobacterium sp. VKM Ac-1395]|uniref:Type 1 glutamine amidotransferase-like domain-containing protein n=1 Tax=Curtobacterium sp. VKM Ac-1395 TaxID=2783815 RepID=UPI00188CC6EE|nr:Type 1 glutamine amidotransferase-like domain-containing protein [Curtobacterium sp. VKM Ac-1395]MBF4589571.1 Type 1 glutamine amidotransferase-like domain-containing protein [Curtobacterium sp. VKM Ac-1395]